MLSIIIADDEVDIIDLCKALIEYPDAAVIGEAHNGLELLDEIDRLHPDAVITDICMPGLTGLELIEKAKQAYPDVSFIVMSGYTDFQYAQTALRFGVWDYLLKPLKKTEVNQALRKLDEHRKEKQNREQHSASIQDELQESIGTLRERYLKDIWDNGVALPQPKIGNAELFQFDGTAMQCVAFSVDSNFTATVSEASALGQQAGGALDKIRALAETECNAVCMFTDWPVAACLLLYDAQTADVQSPLLLKQIGHEIRALNSANHFIHLASAASALEPGSAAALPETVRQAKAALKWRLEKKQSDVIAYDVENEAKLNRQPSFAVTKWKKTIEDAVERLDAKAAADAIRQAWDGCIAERQAAGSRYRLLEELLHCLNGTFARLPGSETASAPVQPDVFDILSGGYEEQEIVRRLSEDAAKRIAACQAYAQHRENSMIHQAKAYVAQHYAENISLNQVAKQVCLSASYLSTLFKAETGSGFVEHLQHVRIQQAKKLLKESKMRIADIAQAVGYRDIRFFNKVFFKETSVTPSEYRKFYG